MLKPSMTLLFLSQWLYSQFFITPTSPTHDSIGQTVIVTGSNTVLGLEVGEKAKESILASTKRTSDCVEVWELDLSSTVSVKAFATRAQQLDRVDVLVENAGILPPPSFTATADGNETALQTNVMSTFLLALLLLPKLKETAEKFTSIPHLVVVTSEMHHITAFKENGKADIYAELNSKKAYAKVRDDRYGVTKLLELLLVRELAKHISPPPVITAVSPGFCYSDIVRDIKGFTRFLLAATQSILARSTEVGSWALVGGACAGSASHGKYRADGANQEPARWISKEEGAWLQRRVYEQTMDMLERIKPGIKQIV